MKPFVLSKEISVISVSGYCSQVSEWMCPGLSGGSLSVGEGGLHRDIQFVFDRVLCFGLVKPGVGGRSQMKQTESTCVTNGAESPTQRDRNG